MRILLDVCTPVQVRQALPGHEVRTAVSMGWGELENGDLLREGRVLLSQLAATADSEVFWRKILEVGRGGAI